MLTGEAIRTLDPRFRLSLPAELAEAVGGAEGDCLLAKERPGCLSLWRRDAWEEKQRQATEIVSNKLASGRLDARLGDVQRLGRLLSTRQRPVQLAGRGRLVIPEGFRELLGVEAGGDVVIVGAAVCVEIWNPTAWADLIGAEMPTFRDLFEDLAG
ncbi:MraZ-like protein [Planctomycetes bacterium MalM25]|nr:MraZ-like protein [Planctomycetes bacterium MalM25]